MVEDYRKKTTLALDMPLNELLTKEEMDVTLDPPYVGPTQAELKKIEDNSRKITQRHLLSHTAGFVENHPQPREWKLQLMGQYKYSKFGYQLLGIIIGKHDQYGDSRNPLEGFKRHIEKQILKEPKWWELFRS